MDGILPSRPQVWFEVEKIIGVSTDGNSRCYKVQWAPAWVSSFHLAGCEGLIQEFLQQKEQVVAEKETESIVLSNESNITHQSAITHVQVDNSGPGHEIKTPLTSPKVRQDDDNETTAIPNVSHSSGELASPDHVVYVLPSDESVADLQNNSHADFDNKSCSETRNLNEKADFNNATNDLCTSSSPMNYGDPIDLKCPKMTTTPSLSFIINNDPAHPWNRTGNSKDICKESFHPNSCEADVPPSLKDINERSFLNHPNFNNPVKGAISNHDMLMNEHITVSGYLDGRVGGVGGGGTKFRCPSCNITTATKQKMEEHARVHTGHRPYRCIVCDKLFKRKQDLKRHSNIHTGLKPHKCPACDRGFCDKSNLNQHIKLCTLMRTIP